MSNTGESDDSPNAEVKHCLDLFSGLGGFSAAFADSPGWRVTTVDLDPGGRFDPDVRADVMDLRPSDFDVDYDVILVGFPCTYMTPARNMSEGGDEAWDGDTPASDGARDHVAMLHHTIGLVNALSPDDWFLENPTGRLRSILGPPTGMVTQCQYGRDGQKPTDLWGDHPPMTYRKCSRGDPCHESASYDRDADREGRQGTLAESDDPAERAKLPYELSESLLEAVEVAYETQPPEQATLGQSVAATDGGAQHGE